jgi:hypothetical protein
LALLGDRAWKSPRKTCFRLAAKIGVESHSVRRWASRQAIDPELELKIAALRDLHRVFKRGGKIGEERLHLPRAFEVILGREMSRPARVIQQIPARDTNARLVSLEIVRLQELDRMRRHHGKRER